MLTAAEITAAAQQVDVQSGEGFLTIALLGVIVVGALLLGAKALFGRDDQ